MKKILLLLSLVFAQVAKSDLVSDFKALDKITKGPFDQNILQGPSSRVGVLSGWPAGGVLFQAAYRNSTARRLSEGYEFYVGNLFTTNYYELIGEYVYNNRYGSHSLNHQGLLAKKAQALPKIFRMTQHWVLEKAYVRANHQSRLAKAYGIRGIGGSEFEQVFAPYYFNFFLSAMTDESQYLAAFLLANSSPIGGANQLQAARDSINSIYESVKGHGGEVASRMWHLRNLIHNQLSSSVIDEISKYQARFPGVRKADLQRIKESLIAFFDFGALKITKVAQEVGQGEVAAAATRISKEGVNSTTLLELSNATANLRLNIVTAAVPYDKKANTLRLMIGVTNYLNKELINLKTLDQAAAIASVNLIFAQGHIIQDNWVEFKKLIAKGDDLKSILSVAIQAATESLKIAFEPALGQWITIQPSMVNFIDNTIKSSGVNTIALLMEKK